MIRIRAAPSALILLVKTRVSHSLHSVKAKAPRVPRGLEIPNAVRQTLADVTELKAKAPVISRGLKVRTPFAKHL